MWSTLRQRTWRWWSASFTNQQKYFVPMNYGRDGGMVRAVGSMVFRRRYVKHVDRRRVLC